MISSNNGFRKLVDEALLSDNSGKRAFGRILATDSFEHFSAWLDGEKNTPSSRPEDALLATIMYGAFLIARVAEEALKPGDGGKEAVIALAENSLRTLLFIKEERSDGGR